MAVAPKLKMTRQRQAIMDALRVAGDHPTADEVYRRVRQDLPQISLGTVYRNLAVLAQAGLLRHVEVASAPSRFDADLSRHYHIRCQQCGRIDDVGLEPVDGLDGQLRGITDYDVRGHRIEFLGLCPQCRDAGREG